MRDRVLLERWLWLKCEGAVAKETLAQRREARLRESVAQTEAS